MTKFFAELFFIVGMLQMQNCKSYVPNRLLTDLLKYRLCQFVMPPGQDESPCAWAILEGKEGNCTWGSKGAGVASEGQVSNGMMKSHSKVHQSKPVGSSPLICTCTRD